MRQLRECTSSQLNTGVSKCQPDWGKMKGAILVEPGTKLPAKLTAETLEKLVHEDRPNRVYGIFEFVEYAKNGGEMQTAANGYGPEERTGLSARKDTFTMRKFHPELYANLTKCEKDWDVYFFNDENMLFGLNDGTDILAGIPMCDVYADATEFATSSAKPVMTVIFSHADAKNIARSLDFIKLDFYPGRKIVLGLTEVKLQKVDDTSSNYKLFEVTGGYDVTSIYGPVIAEAGNAVINDTSTAVTYNKDSRTLTISGTGEISLKSPKVLYENDIKGIEQVA